MPIDYGGSGWTARQRQIFEEEALLAGAPPFHIQSIFLIGPLIAAFGTPEQKRDPLPAIREGRELWAQGFSKPDSGSDLASLRTRAVREGDHYVVNRQKIWTSDGHYCDRMFALVRTDPVAKPQAGISMLLFPLETGVAAILNVPHGAPVGVAPSILKIQGTELMQATLQAEVAALGPHGIVAYDPDPARNDQAGPIDAPGVSAEFLFLRAATIYGGSTEIQLGIIAKTLKRMSESEDESTLTEEQAMLRDSIRRFAKAPSKDVWATAAEQGWLAATLPDAVGGLGGSAADGVVVAREFGRGMIAAPLTNALMAVRAIVGTGAFGDLVAQWAEGKVRLAFAHDERGARGNPIAAESHAEQRDGWRLTGRKLAVADGAEQIVVTAQTPIGMGLFLVDTAVIDKQRYATIDGRLLIDIALGDTPAELIALDSAPAIVDAIGRGLLDLAAEAVGLIERAFWLCRDYLTSRKQFGRALIEFQVLEHRLARIMMEAMVCYGLDALELRDPKKRMRCLSAVKSRVGRSAVAVGQQAVQLHGGIALTREYTIGMISPAS